jgi:hypothetical protein
VLAHDSATTDERLERLISSTWPEAVAVRLERELSTENASSL